MAEELKPESEAPPRLTKKAYRDTIASINHAKEEARTHNGEAAKATRDFCDDHELDKQATTTVAKLARKEPGQQQAFLRDLIAGADFMGMFDQSDAFGDSPVEMMRKVVERADKAARTDVNGAEEKPRRGGLKAVETEPEPASVH